MSEPRLADQSRLAEPAPVELVEVGRQVVALLTSLQRPPRSLRVEMGTITVDIAWDGTAPAAIPATLMATVAPQPEAAPAIGAADAEYLRAPAVGVFYHAPEPGAEPFVALGSAVVPKQQIGIVEVMKLMIPVEADRAGTITAVLKGNGETVEFDEPLFAIETAAG